MLVHNFFHRLTSASQGSTPIKTALLWTLEILINLEMNGIIYISLSSKSTNSSTPGILLSLFGVWVSLTCAFKDAKSASLSFLSSWRLFFCLCCLFGVFEESVLSRTVLTRNSVAELSKNNESLLLWILRDE